MFPAQVLDMQADLIDRNRDPRFRAVLKSSFALDLGVQDVTAKSTRAILRENAEVLTDNFALHVKAAHAYRVTPDMSLLVQHAAAGLDESDEFHRDLAPTGCGIVRFDRPLPMTDIRGKQMKLHWLIWGPVGVQAAMLGAESIGATLMTWFNDSHDPDDASDLTRYPLPDGRTEEDVTAMLGRWRWVGAEFASTGKELGPSERSDWFEGTVERVEAAGDTISPATNPTRYVHALWLLMGQSITAVTDEFPDRAGRRRAGKANLPPRVSVIHLRRSEGGARAEGESQVEWSHRWLVRRYWKWQPRGPLTADHAHIYAPATAGYGGMVQLCVVEGCENYRARISVAGHEKGPADKPLVVSDKVYSLDR